jgi:hypothetical protein
LEINEQLKLTSARPSAVIHQIPDSIAKGGLHSGSGLPVPLPRLFTLLPTFYSLDSLKRNHSSFNFLPSACHFRKSSVPALPPQHDIPPLVGVFPRSSQIADNITGLYLCLDQPSLDFFLFLL